MLDFLQGIVDAITFAISFVGMILTGLIQFIMMIPQMITFVTTMGAFIPSFLLVFFLASVSIAMVLVIIGRKT